MIFRCLYPLIRLLLRLLFTLFGGYEVVGGDRIPLKGAVLLAPNHLSDIDHFALGLTTRRLLWFMGKSELFEIRWLKPVLVFLQAFPVHRDSPDRAALRHAEELLKGGKAVVIYAEGRDSLDGKLQPLNPGAAMLAIRTHTPIVPVGIIGTSSVMPVGKFVPRLFAAKTILRVGQPIDPSHAPEELSAREKREWLTDQLFNSLKRLTGQ